MKHELENNFCDFIICVAIVGFTAGFGMILMIDSILIILEFKSKGYL